MRTASGRKIWIATMAILAAVGWTLLDSPWAEWAPAGARWPSMVAALLFGLTAFLSIAYYPLFASAFLAPIAFGASSGERPYFRSALFLNGAVFLVGFAGVFALQSMAILPIKSYGAGSNFLLKPSAGGLFVLAALIAISLSLQANFKAARGGSIFRHPLTALLFLLGLGWGVYFGHDLDPAYDRTFFRVGAGPGSHEAPALILFGIGLLSLHALWTWGAAVWMGNALARRSVRLGAGVGLALLGFLMVADVHPF